MKKIFLLDDNVEFIEITELVLGKEFDVRSSSSVDNITSELKEFNPDLILIDHFIGDNNSEEIVHHLQNSIPGFSVPFVLFSASHDIEKKAEKLGAIGFIEKPSSIAYIKNYIRTIFQQN